MFSFCCAGRLHLSNHSYYDCVQVTQKKKLVRFHTLVRVVILTLVCFWVGLKLWNYIQEDGSSCTITKSSCTISEKKGS